METTTTTTSQAVMNVALFISSIIYVFFADPAPTTFFLFAISICGLLAAIYDMADKYKEALVVSILATIMLFGTLYNAKSMNAAFNIENLTKLRTSICNASPLCVSDVETSQETEQSKNKKLLTEDPVVYVESIMAKLDMKLNEYERVNLKALKAAKDNNEISDEGVKAYKKYLTDMKTSNYKSNFIRLTMFANTFSLETCNKYNSKAFCDDLASQTIPEIKMNHTIRFESFIRTGLMNHEQTKKYLDLVHDKLDKALDKRPERVLTDREVNNIFESVPTKQ